MYIAVLGNANKTCANWDKVRIKTPAVKGQSTVTAAAAVSTQQNSAITEPHPTTAGVCTRQHTATSPHTVIGRFLAPPQAAWFNPSTQVRIPPFCTITSKLRAFFSGWGASFLKSFAWPPIELRVPFPFATCRWVAVLSPAAV
jgi:hypothetical protein